MSDEIYDLNKRVKVWCQKYFITEVRSSITMHQIFERRRHLRLTLNQKMVTKPREVFIFLGDQESRGINNSRAYFEVFSDFEC